MNIPYFCWLKLSWPRIFAGEDAIGRHLASSSSISGDPGTPEPQGPVAVTLSCEASIRGKSKNLIFITVRVLANLHLSQVLGMYKSGRKLVARQDLNHFCSIRDGSVEPCWDSYCDQSIFRQHTHKMEPKNGIEPSTYSLRMNCSTN